MIKFSELDIITMMRLLHIAVDYNRDLGLNNISTMSALQHGLIFIDNNGDVLETIDRNFTELAIDTLGLDNETWSGTLHKSWDKVENVSDEQLIFEQVIHYFSTYGMEFLGLPAMPVIPHEDIISDKNALPNVKAFTVIRVVDAEDALKIIEEYICDIKSPHKNEVEAIISLMEKTSLTADDLTSFELKIARYDQLGTVPANGQDFLQDDW